MMKQNYLTLRKKSRLVTGVNSTPCSEDRQTEFVGLDVLALYPSVPRLCVFCCDLY